MTKKRDGKPEQRKPEKAKSVSRRNFLTHGAVAGVSAAALGGSVSRDVRARKRRRQHQMGLRGGRRSSSARALPECPAPSGRVMPACACSSSTRTSTSAARCCTQAARSLSAAATRASCGTSPEKATRRGSSRSPRCTSRRTSPRTPISCSGTSPTGRSSMSAPTPRIATTTASMHRAWADNCYGTRQFLMDNYVRFGRITGTHSTGGVSRARRAITFLMLGDKTDIKAGTVTRQDAGIADKSSSHFAPRLMESAARFVGPGAVWNGAALTRCLEFSAREKGVQVHAQPAHDRARSRAAVLGTGPGRQGELYAAVRPGHRRAAGEPQQQRQRRRAPRHHQHPRESGRLRRQRRSRQQSAVPQHVLSRIQRARLCVERVGAARAARPGRQRHHCQHADRRQSFGHAAESRDHPELPHPAATGDARRLQRHAARTPDLPVPPLHRHRAGRQRLPAPDRGESGGQALLQ